MDRAAGGPARKQPQPPSTTAAAATTPSTRASRSSHVEPQIEASNGVPLVDKTSRKRTAAVENPPRPNKATATSRLTVTRATSPMPNRDDELLKLLKNEFEALRSHVTCTICYGLLYEPYTTQCGHTFCYGCLCKSFSEDQTRVKSCPACRTAIRHAPAEAYLVRDMTQSFTKHIQLLGPDETLDQHEQTRKEHRAAVLKDKNNKHPRTGGLFKGFFTVRTLRPWQDPEDGVDRCQRCMWELVDGLCEHCGQDYGTMPANYFSGYSETGESSEQAPNDDFAEFLEMDMEMDYDDFEEDNPEDWWDQHDQFNSEVDRTYALRRYFGNAPVPPVLVIPRSQRLASHSAARSRRRSGPAPLSEMMESEMGSIMEEDEDEEAEEEEDTSMDGFIVDDSESQSQSSASASEQTPQPPTSRAVSNSSRASSLSSTDEGGNVVRPGRSRASGRQGQAVSQSIIGRQTLRRPAQDVIGSPQIQTINNTAELDEEDELPIANGRRRQASQRAPARNIRRQRSVVREASEEADWSYRPLGRQGNDDVDGDDGSDGTTVGWEPTTISNDRTRNGGSLTPTADRPHPLQRQTSLAGISALPPGSRGLRRRSSVLSNSTRHYEDNDADDDGTDADGEGENAVSRPQLRPRGSRIRITDNNTTGTNITNLPPPQVGTNGDLDSEESDLSERSPRGGLHVGPRAREYDPRISFIFATMQQDLGNGGEEDIDMASDTIQQLRGLARTPIARPRTANRNRPSNNGITTTTVNSPGSASRQVYATTAAARLRPPVADRNQPTRVVEERGPMTRTMPSEASTGVTTVASASTTSPFTSNRTLGESIQRPPSRLPSGFSAARRYPGEVQVVQDAFQGTYMPPGLNPARAFQSQTRNPFYTHVRPRPSAQRLRDQPSNATLRSRQSTRGLRQQPSPANQRVGVIQTSQLRPQASRINIRNENSTPRLPTQPPPRNMRMMNVASSPPTAVDRPASFATTNSATGGLAGFGGFAQSPTRQMVESPTSASSTSTSNPFLRVQRQTLAAGPSAPPRQENPRPAIFQASNTSQGSPLPPASRAVTVEIPESAAAAARRRSGQAARVPTNTY